MYKTNEQGDGCLTRIGMAGIVLLYAVWAIVGEVKKAIGAKVSKVYLRLK